jgi:catechol 2,3-dioxygenase-like lactoylglutathione lyase family enzyme
MPASVLQFVMNVADIDGTVAFFTDVLDVADVGGWDRGPDDRGALLEICPGGVVEVVGHGAGFAPSSYQHDALAVRVDSPAEVEAFFRRCTGTAFHTTPPVVQSWGHYSASVRGPLGLEVVLYCEQPA